MKDGQEESSQPVKRSVVAGFGARLREAFGNISNAEIARRLNVSESGVKNYLDEDRVPPAEGLLTIRRLTNCSVDWLLTGRGPKKADDTNRNSQSNPPSIDLPEPPVTNLLYGEEERVLRLFANQSRLTYWEAVRELTLQAMVARGVITIRTITTWHRGDAIDQYALINPTYVSSRPDVSVTTVETEEVPVKDFNVTDERKSAPPRSNQLQTQRRRS